MITDKLLMFSEAQAVTNTAASTDVIDLGPIDGNRRDIGVGYPLEFWALVNEAATASGEATVNIQLQTSENNSSWSTIYDSGELAKATLKAGKRVVSAKVPAGVQRYLRVNYSVATGPLTAGKFTAGISLDVDANTNGQVVIRDSAINEGFNTAKPWADAVISNRPFAGNTGSVDDNDEVQRNLNDTNYNRMWEYNNRGVGSKVVAEAKK